MTARSRTILDQLLLFALGVLAFCQLFVVVTAADVVFRRHGAFDLLWAVGLAAVVAVPFYVFGFRSLKREGRPPRWIRRVVAALVMGVILLYASLFAIFNIHGS